MNCTYLEPYLFASFVVATIVLSYASSKMNKCIDPEIGNGLSILNPGVLFDLIFTNKHLMGRGAVWRNIVIVAFIACFLSGMSFTWATKQDWVCSVFT